MKKLTALCLTFVLAFALSVPAFATSSDTVVNADIINFTPEEIAEQKAIDARLREEFSSAPETRRPAAGQGERDTRYFPPVL